MKQYINTLMGVIGGISLMALKVLGTPIIDYIQFRVSSGGNIGSTFILLFGVLYDAITLISLIGMVITIMFSGILLNNVFKSQKNNS